MYTDDKNAQVVLSLLKQYGIKKIVVSPGTTNVPIARSVQVDPWFEAYSVVDERSAAYFACGLAYQSGEPVVISCTGATASRNYLPGLTEAFYRNLPIIALTSQLHTSDFGNLVPQITDRTVSQNDVKKISVHLPVVKDDEDLEKCVLSVNKALINATARGGGPVHINLPVDSYDFTTKKLPSVRKIVYYDEEKLELEHKKLSNELKNKKIAVFVGSHKRFNQETQNMLEKFALSHGAAVIIDHTSSYKGKNRILLAQIADLKRSSNRPEIVIDLGSVTGEYSVGWLFGIETWRLSEDGEIHDRMHSQTKLFDCLEKKFFTELVNNQKEHSNYFEQLSTEVKKIIIPDLPLSNTLISYELSKSIPNNCNLHMGILNSLRNMNFFNLDISINTSSNVGGFGIDGALSTIVGQSVNDSKRITFGLVGDLAAFYDMNALGNRHIENNVRILLANNNGGVEFRLNKDLEEQWSDDTNKFISARGHNGSIKSWAESMGFYYMSAKTKKELKTRMKNFCTPKINQYNKPVIFEVFTEVKDEQDGWEMIRSANHLSVKKHNSKQDFSYGESKKTKIRNTIRKITPEKAKKIYREIRRK